MMAKVNQARFESEVLHSSLPVIVEFWAERSRPLKIMAPLLNERAMEHAARVKIGRESVYEHHPLAQQHHTETIPTLIYYARGLVRDYLVGVQAGHEIVSRLEALSFAV